MSEVLFLDTETTGLPVYGEPSGGDNQPHLVQLAAVLCDEDSGSVISELDVIIKPDGWIIPQETIDLHGITEDIAAAQGIPEQEALELFLAMRGGCKRVAHNKSFDQRIIRIATKRYSSEEVIDKWAIKDDFECTMALAKPITQIPLKSKKGFKGPKLSEAYKCLTGKELEGAHNAMVDTKACMEIYFAIKNGDYAK